MFEIKITDFRN